MRLVVICVAAAGTAYGQPLSSLPLPPDEVRSPLARAESLLNDGNYIEAVNLLQQVLDHDEDYFLPPGTSVKRSVGVMLRDLPPEGRAAYERRFNAAAQALLEGDVTIERLSEVVRRFFWLQAGRDAARLLAQRLFDAGDVRSAARIYDQLLAHPDLTERDRITTGLAAAVCWLAADNRELVRARLESGELTAQDGDPLWRWIAVADARVEAPGPRHVAGGPPVMFRGTPSRDGIAQTAVPVGTPVWNYPVIDEFDIYAAERLDAVRKLRDRIERQQRLRDEPVVLMPADTIVATHDLALMRDFGTVKAISLETGELMWVSVIVDEAFDVLTNKDWRPEDQWHADHLKLLLGQRMWRDLTSAALSADDNCVYSISDGGLVSPVGQLSMSVSGLSSHPLGPHPYNHLAAYELRSGRLQWLVGGPAGPHEAPFSGAFFLGPPLPDQGRLYCLIEDRGQVRLAVLDADTGNPLWAQPLYNPQINLSSGQLAADRRLAGLTPAARGDVVVCPTGETTVVAVDRRRRELLWSYRYREPTEMSQQQNLAIRMRIAQQQAMQATAEDALLDELLLDERWFDAAPVISGEFVLLTPPDSNELHCVQLRDGTEVWRRPRGEGLYLAGVHRGSAIVVGKRQIEAIALADGTDAWAKPVPIPPPSGRGYQHDRWLVLPLSTGEIASIDLDAARVVARSPRPSGSVPGNLVAVDGRVLIRTGGGLEALPPMAEQVRSLEARFAAAPNDPAALALRGEFGLHLGHESAMSDLMRALELGAGERTNDIVFLTLLDELRTSRNGPAARAATLEQLARTPPQRRMFLRTHAETLERTGNLSAAYREYLRFGVEIAQADEPAQERIDASHVVSIDALLQGRLDGIVRAGSVSRDELDRHAAGVAEKVLAGDDPASLRMLLSLCPGRRSTESLREAYVRHLDADASAAELEEQLLVLAESEHAAVRAGALVRLARLDLKEGNADRLRATVAALRNSLADVPAVDGKTGSAWIEQWSALADFDRLIRDPWPANPPPIVTVNENSGAMNVRSNNPVMSVHGPRASLLDGWTFHADERANRIFAFDAQGRSAWNTPLTLPDRGAFRGTNSAQSVFAVGRLAAFVTNSQLTVVDVASGGGTPSVLINESLQPNLLRSRFGGAVVFRMTGNNDEDSVGPFTDDRLVFRAENDLKCIDPHTGRSLWERDMPQLARDGELFGDAQYVLFRPAKRSEVAVLSAIDGRDVASRELPAGIVENAIVGRFLLFANAAARGDAAHIELGLFDPAEDAVVWSRTFENVVDWDRAGGDSVWIRQQGNIISLVDLPSGQSQYQAALTSDAPLTHLAVHREGGLHLVTSSDAKLPDGDRINGSVFGVDPLSGEVLWTARMENCELLTLPQGWPIVAFARPVDNGTIEVTIIDKQTGTVLHQGSHGGRFNQFGWYSEPDLGWLAIDVGTTRIRLQYDEGSPKPADQ